MANTSQSKAQWGWMLITRTFNNVSFIFMYVLEGTMIHVFIVALTTFGRIRLSLSDNFSQYFSREYEAKCVCQRLRNWIEYLFITQGN